MLAACASRVCLRHARPCSRAAGGSLGSSLNGRAPVAGGDDWPDLRTALASSPSFAMRAA
eukprot:4786487-Alexandrium_andersonii.AAC.1